jgi:hypothetical protein
MNLHLAFIRRRPALIALAMAAMLSFVAVGPARAQDPAEPPAGKPAPKLPAWPSGRIPRSDVSEKDLRGIITQLVACGTRSTLSSWTDPKRGVGCGRDHIVARFDQIAKASGGRLQVVVDKWETSGPRTGGKTIHLENVYAILPGTDPVLKKTIFIVSGHYDSRASNVMDADSDAPGADDDGSGTAVSIECARLLADVVHKPLRATVLFATVSGEEQGLYGGTRLEKWVKEQGYTVGGMLDNDIVGADFTPGAPHRVRLFSGNGEVDDCDGPARELSRLIEEIDGVHAIRMIFRLDRYGRGGDQMPFYRAGDPSVRFTEPVENYDHEHQTPRTENGVFYGDEEKFLNFQFMGNVAHDNAEALRELALAPAPPTDVILTGAVTPSAKLTWKAEPDAERAGFEVLWRDTTHPRWSVYDYVTSGDSYVFKDVSTDNHYFAVRAVGKNGARSIAVPGQPPPRRQPPWMQKPKGQ